MSTYYTGTETSMPECAVAIDAVFRDDSPEGYTADPDLAAAVNVALILGKPLLLTGEPGTGKTQLAWHVAMALGLGKPERFDTKSTSQASDLFYRFDSLTRFHAAHAQEKNKRALDFVSFGPLGKAILHTLPPSHDLFQALDLRYPTDDEQGHPLSDYPRRSVVLIDEIDKAPRDFPNDLLDAIDNLRFNIKELEKETLDTLLKVCKSSDISVDKALRPVVIITSNSEKNLPDPFLRRCVYFHIPFPEDDQLRIIVARRVTGPGSASEGGEALTTLTAEQLASSSGVAEAQAKPLLRSAVEFFARIRGEDLRKRPSTAELIDWVRYLLKAGAGAGQDLKEIPELARQSLGVLVKSIEDLQTVQDLADKHIRLTRA
jgi:MoxR-like ATPase